VGRLVCWLERPCATTGAQRMEGGAKQISIVQKRRTGTRAGGTRGGRVVAEMESEYAVRVTFFSVQKWGKKKTNRRTVAVSRTKLRREKLSVVERMRLAKKAGNNVSMLTARWEYRSWGRISRSGGPTWLKRKGGRSVPILGFNSEISTFMKEVGK